MTAVKLAPFYRNAHSFDRLASLFDNTLTAEHSASAYPPYDIEMFDENHFAITVAVTGFTDDDLDVTVDRGILSISGKKPEKSQRTYLHQGISHQSFERRFNLENHIEVTGAECQHGLLTVFLKKEIPEAMKPRKISITTPDTSTSDGGVEESDQLTSGN